MKNEVFREYRNKHEGQRLIIVANGPSLADTNLDLLKGEVTMAMNRIPLIYEKNKEWRPTYYLFSSSNVKNPVWGKQWTESVKQAASEEKTTAFIANIFKNYIDPKDKLGVKWFHSMSERKPTLDGRIQEYNFSLDVIERIDKTGSTINLALQLANLMGFSEIAVVGADLGWKKENGLKGDKNHFSNDYRADIPRPYKANHQMRNVHSLAHKIMGERVKFYNLTKSTVLDIYPIIDFESYITENKIVPRREDDRRAKEFWDRKPQFGGWQD